MFGWLLSQGAKLLKPVGEFLGKEVLSPIKNMVLDSGREMLQDTLRNLSGQVGRGRFDSEELLNKARDSYGRSFKRRAVSRLDDFRERLAPPKRSYNQKLGPLQSISGRGYTPRRQMIEQPMEEEEDYGLQDMFQQKEFEEE